MRDGGDLWRDRYGYVRGRWIALVVVVAAVVVIGGATLGVAWLRGAECDRLGTSLERRTEHRLIGGCYVRLEDGRYVPDELYRFNEEAP